MILRMKEKFKKYFTISPINKLWILNIYQFCRLYDVLQHSPFFFIGKVKLNTKKRNSRINPKSGNISKGKQSDIRGFICLLYENVQTGSIKYRQLS